MNKKYLIVAGLFIALGVFLAFTSVKKEIPQEVSPTNLHRSVIENTRYFSVEQVAMALISEDPSMVLIDVRSAKEFEAFSLPNAINIPFDSLLAPSNQDYLNQEVNNSVFYSNGTTLADAAWIICKRKGYTNNFVMLGGLNLWVEHILKPTPSSIVYDKRSKYLLQYRKGASEFFTGASSAPAAATADAGGDKPKGPAVKKTKKQVSGGCG